MEFDNYEVVQEFENVHLIKIMWKGGVVTYRVFGEGPTRDYCDYKPALMEFKVRYALSRLGDYSPPKIK